MPYRVNALVDSMEFARSEAIPGRSIAHAKFAQLANRDHAVLTLCDSSNQPVHRLRGPFPYVSWGFGPRNEHARMVGRIASPGA